MHVKQQQQQQQQQQQLDDMMQQRLHEAEAFLSSSSANAVIGHGNAVFRTSISFVCNTDT
jgi:hypothetical protein